MIRLDHGPDAPSPRVAVRAWLASSLPDDWPTCGPGAWVDDWRRRFYEDGWAVPSWPTHLGGLGLDERAAAEVNDELAAADAPVPYNLVTVRMIGATLMTHASAGQQERFLPELARGKAVWCQLFSEPGSGSDLASLSCRALRDESSWVLRGQKVWSSFASVAQWGLLLARTNPARPKREGITAFAVPMSAPGVSVRPLRQMTGDADFCEVFLDDVIIGDENRIGAIDDGWRVARSALNAERNALGGEGASPVARVGGIDLDRLIASGAISSNVQRAAVVDAWMRERVTSLLSQRLANAPTAAALVKIAQAANNQSLQDLAVEVLGIAAVANEGQGLAATVGWGFLRSRANTIGGGTSEILRNMVGERLLGLPREPDPYDGAEWREVPRS